MDLTRFYDQPVPSTRRGPLYNAFAYPTKIDPEAVALFIACHTVPGEVVLDVFGGSGSTGIAARLCDQPTARMINLADQLGVSPVWGPRDAVVYEISTVGSLVASVLSNPPDPSAFAACARATLATVRSGCGWMYDAIDPSGNRGTIRQMVWSEVLITPCCRRETTLWEAAVSLDPVVFSDQFDCPSCGRSVQVAQCARATVVEQDGITGESIRQRARVPVRVYGKTGRASWVRAVTADDLDIMSKVRHSEVPWVPSDQIYWGDLYRSGYHTGIERYHHLYTPRNLRAVGQLWASIAEAPVELQDALRVLVMSYNASHATLMSRAVAKQNQKDLVITGAQSGVLYVSGLPVEKNVFDGIERKIATLQEAFKLTRESRSNVQVVNASSTRLNLDDASVEYVFTDPPFGDFIPYAEVNQVNEAWLGALTDRTDEAIMSSAQGKDVGSYLEMVSAVFSEVRRVLKATGVATVVFHASKPAVWQALGEAFRVSGLGVLKTSILDKTQVSFKQVVATAGTRHDAVFLLAPSESLTRECVDSRVLATEAEVEIGLEELAAFAASGDDVSSKRMFSRYVASCIERGVPVRLSASDFYELCEHRSEPKLAHDGVLA